LLVYFLLTTFWFDKNASISGTSISWTAITGTL